MSVQGKFTPAAAWTPDLIETLRCDDADALVLPGGGRISYADLHARIDRHAATLAEGRGVLLVECTSDAETVAAYLAGLRMRCPVLLLEAGRTGAIAQAEAQIRPRYAKRACSDRIVPLDGDTPVLHDDLAVLLSTSGSTGAAKLIRLSHANIAANAASIVDYLGLQPDDRSALTLPLNYSYGLSVLNSHLMAGGSLFLADCSVKDPEFWDAFNRWGCTNFAGVPHIYQLLDRSGFTSQTLPTLRHATQAGGHLAADLATKFATMAERDGWRFFVMYGQTEATARMSYVPPDRLLAHPDCIGTAIPGGSFRLDRDGGADAGELIYSGPNVMMGYAQTPEDLARGPELDELRTGDIAAEVEPGFYRIVGRKSRFIKLCGLRISLDEVDRWLAGRGLEAAAAGDDGMLAVYGAGEVLPGLAEDLAGWLKIPSSFIEVRPVPSLPRRANGKVDLAALQGWFERDRAAAGKPDAEAVDELFRRHFPSVALADDASFSSLGGDSLLFVQFSLDLERTLGRVPADWEHLSLKQLRELEGRGDAPRSLDSSILLRCAAITIVVFNHLEVGRMSWSGGSYILLMLAGYSFARFLLPSVQKRGNILPIVKLMVAVAVPTVAVLLVLQGFKGEPVPETLLLASNFVDPHLSPHGIAAWFVEVYVQILAICALLLSFRRFREFAGRRPLEAAAAIFGVSIAANLVGSMVWDTEPLYNRVPHILFWMFAAGWLLQAARTRSAGPVCLVLIGAASLGLLGVSGFSAMLVGACLFLLVWPRIAVPPVLGRIAAEVAAASLIIYLTHMSVISKLARLGVENQLLLAAGALAGGVVLFRCYELARKRAARSWRSMKRVA